MKKYAVNIWMLFCILTLGCSDFLEEQSGDLTYASSCADLEELLVGDGYANRVAAPTFTFAATSSIYLPGLHVMDDDVEASNSMAEGATTLKSLGAFYRWDANPCHDGESEYDDPSWIALYRHIGVANAVLDEVEKFSDELETDVERVKGQAYFLRGFYYFYLVNLYAQPYDSFTASEDLGVPLKDFSYIDDRKWRRATVQQVYDQIVSDLQYAVHYLSGKEMKSYYWASANAARSMLSRVYCYIGKWEQAVAVCDTVMNGGYALFDAVANALQTGTSKQAALLFSGTPEMIFTMGCNARNLVFYFPQEGFRVSDDLLDLYEDGDYRKSLSFYNYAGYYRPYTPYVQTGTPPNFTEIGADPYASDVFALRLPEVLLNKAEALVMLDREGEARELLQSLREKRIAASDVGTVTESGKELMELVRNERRKELVFQGHRWFDLRRYAVNAKYPFTKEIRHNAYAKAITGTLIYEGYYLLPPYPDNKWVLPIPDFELEENQGELLPNERDESVLY